MNQQDTLPQLTIKGIVLGVILAVVLGGANAYLGLFAGLTVSATIPAAVISMGVLRLFRESNILENNIVQTTASAGEAVAAGVIFTVPALVLMGYWESFPYWWVAAIAGLGGLLGVLFTIPLRRSLIIEEQLTFPEGVATAEVLKVGDEGGGAGLKYLASAALAGGLVKLCEAGLHLWPGLAQGARYVANSVAYVGSNLSPALLAIGYIIRFNISVMVFAGGALAWFIGIPLYMGLYHASDPSLAAVLAGDASAVDAAFHIWDTKIRYVGVGAMLLGGVWALIAMRRSILSGVKSGLEQIKQVTAGEVRHTERDLPMPWVLAGIVAFTVPIFFLYHLVITQVGISIGLAILMVVAGFLFSAVAGYMAGLVGSSNNPVSGITIATVTLASFLLVLLLGQGHADGPAAAILVGAVVCCAAAIGGDNLQDLKCGFIVGATPWRQQLALMVGVVASALVMAPILTLLLEAYGFGPPTAAQPDSLAAPQATLMAAVSQGVFGAGLPWNMIILGMAIAVVIIVFDEYLKRRGSEWSAPVLAVAVGIYLPIGLTVPILLGGLISWLTETEEGDESPSRRHGVLFAAGLIAGEALIGILLAIPIVVSGQPDVLAIAEEPFGAIPGILVLVGLAAWLYRIARA